ncbi:MAG: hypothetical protein LBP68_06405 [Acidobacteriota bacterium]|nr:hypothetical protein [Acidobacteriota bacterium]
MKTKDTKDLQVILEQVQAQLASLAERVAQLEGGKVATTPAPAPAAVAAPVAPVPAPKPATPPAARQEATEEEILAISAALGAYLGVRLHIRQIRLLSSSAWAQQGRVSVQAHIPYTHTSNS